jgi:hypothetical protein
MEDLKYKMIMALNAADFGSPICEQAAEICAEIAEQHCAQTARHRDRTRRRDRRASVNHYRLACDKIST